MITDYTTFNDVRAALGVDDKDLPDSVLALDIYSAGLTQDLEDVDVNLPDTYLTVSAESSPTAQQTRFLSCCSMFAAYAVASRLTATMPLFAPQQETDGKAQAGRFDNAYKDVAGAVVGQCEEARTSLLNAYNALFYTEKKSAIKSYFGVISPSSDPVTGL